MKKHLITLTLLSSLVSGCVTTALVCGATAGGAVIYDQRSMTTQVEDQQQRIAVLSALSHQSELKHNAHIEASVFNNILLLTGETTEERFRAQAVRVSRRAGPFKRIYNRIEIAGLANWRDMGDDTWLTTKIKAAMIAEKGLHSSQIKVITENRAVYLMGVVTKRQAQIATDVARQIPGVQRVTKLFEYTT